LALRKFGGFPEPLFTGTERTLRRWQRERLERLIQEDIREIEQLRDFSKLELLGELLPQKVGSLLSINSLREDLEVAHKTVSHWLKIFEVFYLIYRISPYAKFGPLALKKEQKLYFWDWSILANEGARVENLIASHLFKFIHYLKDYEGQDVELIFIRDKEKREVDFLVIANKLPWFAVEVKSNDTECSRHLLYYKERLSIPFCYQVVTRENIDFIKKGIRVMSVSKFLTALI
jgi:hypothetical protein